MRYKNAKDIFPEDVLAMMQEFADGAYIYIPKKSENHKKWGENTHAKHETQARNEKIYAQYKSGHSVQALSAEYFLSDKSIQRIVTLGKKQEKND
ncbi:MAG: CD3324 family protein [Defluviitaleaceae bacterium]|nr:CD3324 family protein [Defluviitaleaceae bacterium]MCL2275623.1 CD3324 family protein [Defluviitaleaceae bacterium]